MVNYLKSILAFIVTTVVMCVINFVVQIALIFMDMVMQWETSALTIVLWIVTGVFSAVFTQAAVELFLMKAEITYRLMYNPMVVVSALAIVAAIALMIQGKFMEDTSDFTLFFSNGFVFISYFIGSGGFALIARKL